MATNGNAWLQGSDTHDANSVRNFAATVFGLPVASHANAVSDTARAGAYGVALADDWKVTGTGGLNYSIAAGRGVAAGTSSSAQGAYVGYNTAGYVASLDAHSAFIRHDLICYRVRDTDVDATGAEQDDFAVVKGTTGSTDPAIPASLGSLVVLCRAVVPATSGTPTFTDLRPRLTAVGGKHVCTSASRPSGPMRYEGLYITETDTDRDMRWNGTAWEIISEPPQSWVPVVFQPGTATSTNAAAYYQRTRGRFDASATITMTAPGVSGDVIVTLPVTLIHGEAVGGSYTLYDAGGLIYTGALYPYSTTGVRLQVSGQGLQFGTAPAILLATGDIIRVSIHGWYA